MPTTLPTPGRPPRDAALDLLKWLALLSMLIDHLRHVWPQLYAVYIPGRLAFPLFCLAIAANLARPVAGERGPIPLRYLGLLLGFALLSEWPYRLLVQTPQSLNVLPTLALGLLIASAAQHPHGQRRWLGLGALALALFLSCALAPLFGLWLLRQPLALPVPAVGRWAYLFYPGHFLVLVAIREWLGSLPMHRLVALINL